MYRYLAILCDPSDADAMLTFESFAPFLRAKPSLWTTAHERPGALVIQSAPPGSPGTAHCLRDREGVILGTIFKRENSNGAGGTCRSISDTDAEPILTTCGRHLVDHYWGSYVAILHGKDSTSHILREPIGTLPCYHALYKRVHIFFSHVEDCARLLPIAFEVNRSFLIRWLVFDRVTDRQCGFKDVEQIPGGECLTVSRHGNQRRQLWSPVALASTPHRCSTEQAADELRATVQHVVNAWSSCYDNIVHKLSGGLDSSVVAACLALSPSKPQVTYLNFFTEARLDRERLHLPGMDQRTADKLRAIVGQADERYFARLVAERWATPLIERPRSASMDLSRLWQAPLMASPAMLFTSLEVDETEIELATTQNVQAFFSGQSGDSVLLATSRPIGAIDYARLHGLTAGLWEQVRLSARLSNDSIWSVAYKAAKYGLLRRPWRSDLRLLEQPTFLNQDLISTLREDDFRGHWGRVVCELPPGKRSHLSGLDGSAHYDYVFHSGRYADHIDPLSTQPVWELMLQLPTHVVLCGGVSRGLARVAFADLLPEEIRKRRVKGAGTAFYQQLVSRNRTFLRDCLLDGLLVRHGFLNKGRLAAYFQAGEVIQTVAASRVLSYLAAEIWLQQCDAVRDRAAA